jgi:hypothetical protein
LIRNVDISCCGVSFDSKNLYENYENAITHCKNKVYIINTNAKMYSSDRVQHRRKKFLDRGWVEIQIKDLSDQRDIKIDSIFSDIEFVREWHTLDEAREYFSGLANNLIKKNFPQVKI